MKIRANLGRVSNAEGLSKVDISAVEFLEPIKKEYSEQYAHVREGGKKTNAKVSRLIYNTTTAKTNAVRIGVLSKNTADEPLIIPADFFRPQHGASSMGGLCGASKDAPTRLSAGVWIFKPNLGVKS